MYDACFQRIEEKYLVTPAQKRELLRRMGQHIVKDKYFQSFMRNVYFDTQDFDLIRRAIEKPVFRDKFRVRSYEDPAKTNEVFLEMKMKYQGVSHKRRTKIGFEEYRRYLRDGLANQKDERWREIDYYMKFYGLKPMMYIAYDRESYHDVEDKGLRLTFDANLRSRRHDFDLANDEETELFFEVPTLILEIKTSTALPLWLVRELSNLGIFPTSFSKYGRIYSKNILAK